MLFSLVLLAALASPAPSPSPVPTWQQAPLPQKEAQLTLEETEFNQRQFQTVEYNLIGSLLGVYCAKDGGLEQEKASKLIQSMMSSYPVQPFPVTIPCVKQKILIDATGKATREGP